MSECQCAVELSVALATPREGVPISHVIQNSRQRSTQLVFSLHACVPHADRLLKPGRMTLFSVIGGCTVSLIELENQLRAAEEVLGLVEFKGVALGLQRCDNLGLYPILQCKIATFCEMPSWGIRCGLRVLPKAKYANQHLDVPLGLHMATHDPVSERMVSAPRRIPE